MVGPSLLSPNALTFVPHCARPPACERERAAECSEVLTRTPFKNPVAACTPSDSNSLVHAHLLGPPVDEPAHAGQPACAYPKHQGLRAVSGLLDHSLSDLASGYRSQGGNLTVEGPRVPPSVLGPSQTHLCSPISSRRTIGATTSPEPGNDLTKHLAILFQAASSSLNLWPNLCFMDGACL